MVDYRRLICPRPPSPIPWRGCITNGRSLPHVPLTGCSTTTNTTTPRPALVAPFAMRNGINEEFREDQQAAALPPTALWGGPILHGARARAERAYKDWKWAIDDLWADERHRQQLLEEQAARARQEAAAARARQEAAAARAHQEAARRQQLLDEQAARARQEAAATCARQEAAAARARQEAARRQQLLDEQATRARQEAGLLFAKHLFARCVAKDQRLAERRAQARERVAACTIFLWLCRCRLHIRLVRQTSRRQQREAALTCLRYKQDCCRRAALAEEQRRQAAAARAKAAIDETTEQLR